MTEKQANFIKDSLAAVLPKSGNHTIKLSLQCHYALDQVHKPLLRQPTGQRDRELVAHKRKPTRDDFGKFYLVYSIAGIYEGKTEVLGWDSSMWNWSQEVFVNPTFLADLYDKPSKLTIYEIVTTVTDRDLLPQAATANEQAGSRLRLYVPRSIDARKTSMRALAKRHAFVATKQLPLKERYGIAREASRIHLEQWKEEAEIEESPAGKGQDQGFDETDVLARQTVKDQEEGRRKVTDDERRVGRTKANKHQGDIHLAPTQRVKKERPLSHPGARREAPHPHHYDHPERHIYGRRSPGERIGSASRTNPGGSVAKPDVNLWAAKVVSTRPTFPPRSRSPQHSPTERKGRAAQGGGLTTETRKKTPPANVREPRIATETKTDSQSRERTTEIRIAKGRAESADPGPRRTKASVHKGIAEPASTERKKREIQHVVRSVLDIDPTDLFLGELSTDVRLHDRVEGIRELKVRLAVDDPLLNPIQEESLNPLCITIIQADGMPDAPVPQEELERLCHPVYTRFTFFSDTHVHQAVAQNARGSKARLNNRHVILTGLMDEDTLRDDLLTKKLFIEAHIRDPDKRSQGWNMYGQAAFSLTDLAYGACSLEAIAPILPVRPQPGVKATLPQAFWVESAATLSIQVLSKYPILANTGNDTGLVQGLFGRVLVVAGADDVVIAQLINELVDTYNSSAIPSDQSRSDAEDFSRAPLTEDQKLDPELDILTGYHIFDTESRIFMIEGLLGGGIAKLLAALADWPPSCKIHHNHAVSYTARIWTEAAALIHIKLDPPLRELMQRTSTYLRKRTPQECFECLETLIQLAKFQPEHSHSSIIRYPNAEMLHVLTSTVGQAVQTEEALPVSGMAAEHKELGSTLSTGSSLTPFVSRSGKRIQDRNYAFEQWLSFTRNRHPNHLALNVKKYAGSQAQPRQRSHDGTKVYIYSTQRHSSTARQLAQLRKNMTRDPTHVYSYGGRFLCQIIPAVDYDAEVVRERSKNRQGWLTPDGFRVGQIVHRLTAV
ncbi:hypothetical protein HDU85_004416 [Gaertneriomyces sp. JEL0708]|nr:hypothetical protein HDU85_004416 [Gaertneriomyces sp. JEL0708]